MNRPIKSEFLTCNQIEYDQNLLKYYEALEIYVVFLETQIKNLKMPKNTIHVNQFDDIYINILLQDGSKKIIKVSFNYYAKLSTEKPGIVSIHPEPIFTFIK